MTVEERLYQGAITIWTVLDAQERRFTVYEQNRESGEAAAFGIGDAAILTWDPQQAVVLRA